MVETTVEKDILIVAFRPTIMGTSIRSGSDDCARFEMAERKGQRAREIEEAAEAAEEAEEAARVAAEDADRKEAEAAEAAQAKATADTQAAANEAAHQWKLSMAETKVQAARRLAAQQRARAVTGQVALTGEQLKMASERAAMKAREGEHDAETKEMRDMIDGLRVMLEEQQRLADEAVAELEQRRAEAEQATELEACARQSLHWHLLTINPRLARTRLQEVVGDARKAASDARVPLPISGPAPDPSAQLTSPSAPVQPEAPTETTDEHESPPAHAAPSHAAAAVASANRLLSELEGIIHVISDPRSRKEHEVSAEIWEEWLADAFQRAVNSMHDARTSLQVQSLGCVTLACLAGEIVSTANQERALKLRQGAISAGSIDTIHAALAMLPKVSHATGQQALSILMGTKMHLEGTHSPRPAAGELDAKSKKPGLEFEGYNEKKKDSRPEKKEAAVAPTEDWKLERFTLHLLHDEMKRKKQSALSFFRSIDLDGSGTVTRKEFHEAVTGLWVHTARVCHCVCVCALSLIASLRRVHWAWYR